jgi:DNA-binding NtrC family response regulator
LKAADVPQSIALLQASTVDGVIVHHDPPDIDGMELLSALPALHPPVLFIGSGRLEEAVRAMREGASDYVAAPANVQEVVGFLRKTVDGQRPREGRTSGKSQAAPVIGSCGGLRQVMEMVEQVAPARSAVLLVGETGTGKEVIAQSIHDASPRHSAPFVTVNCAALPEGLLEAELFGYERGAFTGAVGPRPGRFEVADGGTLFLDEIGEAPLAIQAKLLRVLQEGRFERLGSNKTLQVDVRIIAATNRDLRRAIEERRFREDLFYRLDVITIELPPLRSRRGDLPALLEHFLRKYAAENRKTVSGFAPEAIETMLAYDWPGNVRELENAVARAVVLTRSPVIPFELLPPSLRREQAVSLREEMVFPVGTSLEQMERVAIQRTLELTGGQKERAASLLGIGVATLYRKLAKMQRLPAEDEERRGRYASN